MTLGAFVVYPKLERDMAKAIKVELLLRKADKLYARHHNLTTDELRTSCVLDTIEALYFGDPGYPKVTEDKQVIDLFPRDYRHGFPVLRMKWHKVRRIAYWWRAKKFTHGDVGAIGWGRRVVDSVTQ